MPKALCIAGIVIAALLFLVFGLDLATGFPFGKVDWLMDSGFLVSSLILAYLGWTTWKDQI
ncbi:MAG: hypothetical protein HQ567_27210 [Candidatus Nealsonbacteria bacterium]|nr:hypothetical protein [Candidatus Nealsonbacteria bacterium]